MKIVVLIKQVPDTWGERRLNLDTGWLDRASGDNVIDEITERALEVALSLKDASSATEVVVMTMAPADAAESLKKALAMGCDSAVHIMDDSLAGADVALTSLALTAAIEEVEPDLVIAGNESTDGRGGVIPAMIAEHLEWPLLGNLGAITVEGSRARGVRQREDGTQTVSAELPAVISVNESNPDARFPSFKGIMGAKKKPVSVRSLADLGVSAPVATTSIISTIARPARTAGTKIVDDGTAGAKLADFLVSNRLV